MKNSTIDTITGVTTKKLPSGKMLYTVRTEAGLELATFKAEIAEQARKYEGEPAEINYAIIKKGEYENYWLDSVEGAGFPENGNSPLPAPDSKDAQIARAVALKAAVEFLSTPEQERESLSDVLDTMDLFVDKLLGRR